MAQRERQQVQRSSSSRSALWPRHAIVHRATVCRAADSGFPAEGESIEPFRRQKLIEYLFPAHEKLQNRVERSTRTARVHYEADQHADGKNHAEIRTTLNNFSDFS